MTESSCDCEFLCATIRVVGGCKSYAHAAASTGVPSVARARNGCRCTAQGDVLEQAR